MWSISPNQTLHFVQAKAALSAGQACHSLKLTQPQEWLDVQLTAEWKMFYLWSSTKLSRALATIKNFLADKQVLGADFTYAKYSPRCLTLLADRRQMSFQTALLVEPLWIYAAVRLLERLRTQPTKPNTENSIDLNGDGILFYPDFRSYQGWKPSLQSSLWDFYTADGTWPQHDWACPHSYFYRPPRETKSSSLSTKLPIRWLRVAAFAQMIKQIQTRRSLPELADGACSWATIYLMRQSLLALDLRQKMKPNYLLNGKN